MIRNIRQTCHMWFRNKCSTVIRNSYTIVYHHMSNHAISMWSHTIRIRFAYNSYTIGYDSYIIRILLIYDSHTKFTVGIVNGEWQDGKLENVLYVPLLRKNLFSIGACTARGHVFVIRDDGIDIYSKQNKLIAHGIKQGNNLYKLAFTVTVKH